MELSTLSLKELSDALREKTVSAREPTGAFLERINRFNPELNAFVTVAEEEALAAADEADRRLARGEGVTPLTGDPRGRGGYDLYQGDQNHLCFTDPGEFYPSLRCDRRLPVERSGSGDHCQDQHRRVWGRDNHRLLRFRPGPQPLG